MSTHATRAALHRMGDEVAATQDETLSREIDPRARQSFEAAWRARRTQSGAKPSGRRRAALAIGGLAAAAGLALALGAAVSPARPLSFTVKHDEGKVGAFISARDDLPIHFSDGTDVALARDASARVVAVTPHGAEVVLEGGRVRASVVHEEKSAWTFDVGPYVVHVTGTKFDVAWSPATQHFSIDLREGSVYVTGCAMTPQVVRAGMSMRATCKEGASAFAVEGEGEESARASSADAGDSDEGAASVAAARRTEGDAGAMAANDEADSEAAHGEAPIARAEAPHEARALARPAAPSNDDDASASALVDASPPLDWRALAAGGKNREAMDAVREGFDDECRRGDAKDLMLLAEVARFTGDDARARQALTSLRERFRGASEATTAAFLLGRIAFDRGAYSAALPWFELVERESPDGPFARDAAGRILEAYDKLGDRARARAAASAYLARFADGPHARLARSVLE